MYTICWIDHNGKDRWDRCENSEAVAVLLIREGLEEDEDVLIFGPDAENYQMPPKAFITNARG